MGRRLIVLWAGRHRRRSWDELCAGYRQRIERQLPLDDRQIKVRVAGENRARRRAEGRAMIEALPERCWTIALDPGGKMLSSEDLAALLRRLAEQWPHPIAFLIGSDLGLDREVTQQARQRLSLGPMVFSHELARLVLYEQIYRALSIERGIKYHRPAF